MSPAINSDLKQQIDFVLPSIRMVYHASERFSYLGPKCGTEEIYQGCVKLT